MALFRRERSGGESGEAVRPAMKQKRKIVTIEAEFQKSPEQLEQLVELEFKKSLAEYYSKHLKLRKGIDRGNPSRMVDWMASYPDALPSFLQSFLRDDEATASLRNAINQLDRSPGIRADFADGFKLKQEIFPLFEREVQSALLAQGLHRKIIQPIDKLKREDHKAIKHCLGLFKENLLPPPNINSLSTNVALSTISVLLNKNAGKQSIYIQELHTLVGMPEGKPEIDFALSIAGELATIRKGGSSHPEDLDHILTLAEDFSKMAVTDPDVVTEIFETASLRNVISGVMHEHAVATEANDIGRLHDIEVLGAVTCTKNLTPQLLSQNSRMTVSQKRAAAAMGTATSSTQKDSPVEAEPIKETAENNEEVPSVIQPGYSEKVTAKAPKIPGAKTVNSDTRNITIVDPRIQQPLGRTIKIAFKPQSEAARDIRKAMRTGLNVAATSAVAGSAVFAAAPTAAAAPMYKDAVSRTFVTPETVEQVTSTMKTMGEPVAQVPGTVAEATEVRIEDGPSERRVNRPDVYANDIEETADKADNVRMREQKHKKQMGSVPVEVVTKNSNLSTGPGVQLGIATALSNVAPRPSETYAPDATTVSLESTLSAPGVQQEPMRTVDVAPVAATVTGRPVQNIYAHVPARPMGTNPELQDRREAAYEASGVEGMTVKDLISRYATEYGQSGLAKGSPSVELEANIASMIDKINSNGSQQRDSKETFAKVVAALQYPDMLNDGVLDKAHLTVPAGANGRELSDAEIAALNNYVVQSIPGLVKQLFAESDDAFYDDNQKNTFARGIVIANLKNVGEPIIARLVKDYAPKVSRSEVRPPEQAPAPKPPTPQEGGEVVENNIAKLVESAAQREGWSKDKATFLTAAAHNGLSPYMIAIIAANVKVESAGYNMGIEERGNMSEKGLGYVQWTGVRRDRLEDAARNAGINLRVESQANADFQVKYLISEMKKRDLREGGKYSGKFNTEWDLYKWLEKNTGSIAEGVYQFERNFERPRDDNQKHRIPEGVAIYTALGFKDGKIPTVAKSPERPASSEVKIYSGNPNAQAQLDSILRNNKNTGSQLWENEEPMLQVSLEKAGLDNGRLPDDQLMVVDEYGHKLNATAGRAFKDMVAAYESETGRKDFNIQPTANTAYRPYDVQVRLKDELGKFAATPGTSNHGWGLAIDIQGLFGKQGFDKPLYKWLIENSHRFGYFHSVAHTENANTPEAHHFNFLLKDY